MHVFRKKCQKHLVSSKKVCTFAPAKQKRIGSVAQLNRASDYGSEGCGFESRRNHKTDDNDHPKRWSFFYLRN